MLWGWTPQERIIPAVDEHGATYYHVEREPEFDAEQYQLLAALEEYEASLGPHGLPLDETTSPFADPQNPAAEWGYEVRVLRDYATSAIEDAEKRFKDHPSRARIFRPVRVDRDRAP